MGFQSERDEGLSPEEAELYASLVSTPGFSLTVEVEDAILDAPATRGIRRLIIEWDEPTTIDVVMLPFSDPTGLMRQDIEGQLG